MKNILLAVASFLMVSVLMFQVALAETLGDDGFAIRDAAVNPASAGDDPNLETTKDGASDPTKGLAGFSTNSEGNAFVVGGDKCTTCEKNVFNPLIGKATSATGVNSGKSKTGSPKDVNKAK